MKTGTATIRAFNGNLSETFIALERNGGRANVLVAPELVQKLIGRFGVRTSEDWTSMDSIIGMKARWTENRMGLLVELEPLAN